MTRTTFPGPGPDRPAAGLLEKLMAAVRPEFRADELVFDPADPVFGGAICRVASCPRTARGGHGLCSAHHDRWVAEGRPGLEEFAAATSPRWHKQEPLACCRAPGCGRGVRRQGLCGRHSAAWERAGQPDDDQWPASLPVTTRPPGQQDCLIGFCSLWTERAIPFCQGHGATWKANGRPGPEEFAGRYLAGDPVPGHERVRLDALPSLMKLEVQYALQRRSDDRQSKAPPFIVMIMVRFLAGSGSSSLLERTEAEWRQAFGKRQSNEAALLAWSYRQVADLADSGGWDAEYPRDAWQMHRLGFEGRRVLDFAGIPQPWLKDLAKRWIRWRLSTGLSLEAGGGRPLRALTRFAAFLDGQGITAASGIDRDVLERYLASLQAGLKNSQQRGIQIGLVGGFLTAIRQHRWDDELPATALFFPSDYPPRPARLPRALAEHVMSQAEQPGSLAREANPAYRLITIILMRCGLRITDALKLPRDCVVTDPAGAPYLRYYNHKMKREALVPVDDELRDLIGQQQGRLAGRWPGGTAVLFPRPTKNPDGNAPVSSATYRHALYRWLNRCDIRDEHGQPVRFTPHQWRHTLGTRLINRDVPQHVVQRILDHDSAEMTAHYARLSDKTVREHWEKARKVNAEGEPVQVSPDGPLGDAAWSKQRLSRATQALPNGYCELPMVKSCPHANSCLTCPMFVTSAEFLPQHHAQRQQTLQIISAAEAAGHARVAEMNRQVAGNLDKVIAALEEEHPHEAADAS